VSLPSGLQPARLGENLPLWPPSPGFGPSAEVEEPAALRPFEEEAVAADFGGAAP